MPMLNEFDIEELEAKKTAEQLALDTEKQAFEEHRKGIILEQWTSWKNHPYTSRLITHLLDVRQSHLEFAENKAVSSDNTRINEPLIESRIIRSIISEYINKPVFDSAVKTQTQQ